MCLSREHWLLRNTWGTGLPEGDVLVADGYDSTDAFSRMSPSYFN